MFDRSDLAALEARPGRSDRLARATGPGSLALDLLVRLAALRAARRATLRVAITIIG